MLWIMCDNFAGSLSRDSRLIGDNLTCFDRSSKMDLWLMTKWFLLDCYQGRRWRCCQPTTALASLRWSRRLVVESDALVLVAAASFSLRFVSSFRCCDAACSSD